MMDVLVRTLPALLTATFQVCLTVSLVSLLTRALIPSWATPHVLTSSSSPPKGPISKYHRVGALGIDINLGWGDANI